MTRYFLELRNILINLAPWLFMGAAIASVLKLALPTGFINRHVGQPGLGSIIKLIMFGIPLPLCSCGVVPTAMGLRKDGASQGATVGFLITTPETGADSILVTAGFLGWPLALYRVGAAVIMGIAGGWTADRMPELKSTSAQSPAEATCTLTPATPLWQHFWNYALDELLRGIYRYLTIGLLIAAAISVLIPENFVSNIPALQGIGGMLVMLVIASPLYVCSTGSVAIAASLIHTGLPLGSALVFLMSGPATNIATMASILKAFGKRIFAVYLSTVILGSIGFGLLFDALFLKPNSTVSMLHHHAHATFFTTWIEPLAAILLTGLILNWAITDAYQALRSWIKSRSATYETLQLNVNGMSCDNCASHIKRDLLAVPGVLKVEVILSQSRVTISGTNLDRSALAAAIQKAGYTVTGGAA
jgi:uncharacterized membrane protein YraQ (UPF0718 family)/copper chaperone CopZ